MGRRVGVPAVWFFGSYRFGAGQVNNPGGCRGRVGESDRGREGRDRKARRTEVKSRRSEVGEPAVGDQLRDNSRRDATGAKVGGQTTRGRKSETRIVNGK